MRALRVIETELFTDLDAREFEREPHPGAQS
jgi:hypothetical protein